MKSDLLSAWEIQLASVSDGWSGPGSKAPDLHYFRQIWEGLGRLAFPTPAYIHPLPSGGFTFAWDHPVDPDDYAVMMFPAKEEEEDTNVSA